MNNKNYRTGFVITLVLTLLGILASVTLFMQLSTTQKTLTLTKSQLSTAQTELTTTQNNFNATQGQLATAQNRLSSAQNDLITTQRQLTTVQNNLVSTQSDLKVAQIQETSLQTSLTTALSQVSSLQNQLSSGHILADPTYASMQVFIASDKTDQNTYNETTYNCVNFSADVIANAAKQDIRCAFISVDYPGTTGHALIAFNTTDKGMVYIEPQNDCLVQLKVGGRYYQEVIPPQGRYFTPSGYDDTVTRFVVVW